MRLLGPILRLTLLAALTAAPTRTVFSQSTFWESTTGSSGEAISITTAADGRIYAAGVGGIYRSTDNGASWTRFLSPGLRGSSVAWNSRTGSLFVAGGGAVYKSTDDGIDWSVARTGNGIDAVLATSDGIVIASNIPDHSPHPQVLRSSDDGRTWRTRSLLGPAAYPACAPFATASNGAVFTAVYFGSVMYSNPRALAWVRLRAPQLRNQHIAHMWTSPSGELFAGDYAGRVVRSVDGGGSWTPIFDHAQPAVPCWSPPLQGFTTDPAGNYYVGYLNDGVYRSSDRGLTWELINSGLPTTSGCNQQVYLPMTFGVTQDGHILVGTDQGIYRSAQAIRGVPLKKYDLAGRDLIPTKNSLSQNYPNPFNPTTSIGFELASDAVVTVTVYNILGQEVASPAHREEFGPGSNELEFDGGNLPSGVYFYRMTVEDPQTGSVSLAGLRKMSLVR